MNQQTKPNYEEELKKEILSNKMEEVINIGLERSPRSHKPYIADYSEDQIKKWLEETINLTLQKAKEEIIGKINTEQGEGEICDSCLDKFNQIINSLESGK